MRGTLLPFVNRVTTTHYSTKATTTQTTPSEEFNQRAYEREKDQQYLQRLILSTSTKSVSEAREEAQRILELPTVWVQKNDIDSLLASDKSMAGIEARKPSEISGSSPRIPAQNHQRSAQLRVKHLDILFTEPAQTDKRYSPLDINQFTSKTYYDAFRLRVAEHQTTKEAPSIHQKQ